MKHFYRTRDRPGNYTNQLILKERREKLKQVKRIIAVLLALTVIMLAACSDFGTAVKAAEIGGGNDVNLDCYGEYISNDELGELISYGGYISKSEYARHINDDSVGASYTPSFEAAQTLKQNGMRMEAQEMLDKVMSSGSYDEALGVIGDYVNITDGSESEDFDEGQGMSL